LGGSAPFFREGSCLPIQHNVDRTKAYLRAKCHLDPSSRLATIDMGRKLGAPLPFWEGGAGSPSNTKSPGLRPSSIPSDILIHAAIWPQQIWAENLGTVPLWGGGAGSPLQCGQGEAYVHAKFRLDPSSRLATVHQRHRETDRTDRQRTDSKGRTVLQTVAQSV